MRDGKKKVLLKGGSLAGTYLMKQDNKEFVRKEISLMHNREYGYVRWYSQMKRIQRYNLLFPGLFPELIRCGTQDDMAFFDMEVLKKAINCHEYICKLTNKEKVVPLFNSVIASMQKMHTYEMPSSKESLLLYIREEIKQKLKDALNNNQFKDFYINKVIVFNGEEIPSMASMMDEYISLGINNYTLPIESYTHGNITLENMMYDPGCEKIYFIDPYDENIIDNFYNEYSQILQSSNSHYELYDKTTPLINGNKVTSVIDVPSSLSYFNELFISHMNKKLSDQKISVVKFFEISQFIRMLPFKMYTDPAKMILFYSLASKLCNDLIRGDI